MIFPNLATPLVKLDLTFEAGSRYQSQPCVAQAANQLMGQATRHHDAEWVAEFLDFRGITIERAADTCTACLSFYFLRRYAHELLPLIREMIEQPVLTSTLFEAHVSKRRQQLEVNLRKTSSVARNIWYEALFGPNHPLGVHATPEDVDRLTPDLITAFWRERYKDYWITLSGNVDDALVEMVSNSTRHTPQSLRDSSPNLGEQLEILTASDRGSHSSPKLGEVAQRAGGVCSPQFSIRVGRVLPFRWNDPDYHKFMVLNTLLGGYFGSRLMSNLREEKGYTYGIYSQTQIYRGLIVFFITADVAAEAADDSLVQVDAEMRRLQEEPVTDDELRRVCTYMRGDHLRSIDGIFELAERRRQMATTGVGEEFFDLFLNALDTTTPADIQRLARQHLSPEEMLHVCVNA